MPAVARGTTALFQHAYPPTKAFHSCSPKTPKPAPIPPRAFKRHRTLGFAHDDSPGSSALSLWARILSHRCWHRGSVLSASATLALVHRTRWRNPNCGERLHLAIAIRAHSFLIIPRHFGNVHITRHSCRTDLNNNRWLATKGLDNTVGGSSF